MIACRVAQPHSNVWGWGWKLHIVKYVSVHVHVAIVISKSRIQSLLFLHSWVHHQSCGNKGDLTRDYTIVAAWSTVVIYIDLHIHHCIPMYTYYVQCICVACHVTLAFINYCRWFAFEFPDNLLTHHSGSHDKNLRQSWPSPCGRKLHPPSHAPLGRPDSQRREEVGGDVFENLSTGARRDEL